MIEPRDNLATRFPVSIKGVILLNQKVLLLKNERDEYELPGGKLEIDEQPIYCLMREVKEETNLNIEVVSIIDSWLYCINQDTRVVIITYGCILHNNKINTILSDEHKELKWASLKGIEEEVMPTMYKESVKHWANVIQERNDSANKFC